MSRCQIAALQQWFCAAEGVIESDAAAGSSQKYDTFWGQYGKAIKLGVIEDGQNRQRLARLLRFHTSKFPDTWTSLEDYVSRMQEDQKQIYYLAGTAFPLGSSQQSETSRVWVSSEQDVIKHLMDHS